MGLSNFHPADFHPAVAKWFEETLGTPSEPQRLGWPPIQAGKHTLIASPTGSGKTLAAFLCAIDQLFREGPYLPDETRVLYISPLKALSNDVQKNLTGPLEQIHRGTTLLPELRVVVRTGDTPAAERARMKRKPPHILVTTPESLYILLTTAGGRKMLSTVRTAIVDEIHALARDKRGSHLALSLERLEALAQASGASRPIQRIGLSATQKPLEDISRFLVGVDRECALVDVGHRRKWDIEIELPKSPLESVCSSETWGEIYGRMAELIEAHRTTLIFVNTRKMAERITARLTEVIGEDQVSCHHGSLSRSRRLDAEEKLKTGRLRALVATASLELGIDIGDVDLVIQVGASRSIATFLQRIGRAGHSLIGIPKGRVFPLTVDELIEAAALMRAVRRGDLDRTPQSHAPLDILAQQIVASCVSGDWHEEVLYGTLKRAWPYRNLTRSEFDAVVALHSQGKRGLLHRDGVGGRLLARRRARLVAVTCGGAIPDVADYRVLAEPDGTFVGTLNEDFAIESNIGDIFQLGNTSWRVLRVESGVVRVADAKGQPPSIPFWLGEAPARTTELSAEIANVREEAKGTDWLLQECGLSPLGAQQILEYLEAGRAVLGTVPTQKRIIVERFFDESGGMQLIIHSPFGGRINRAWGLALRKRFCRGFGFELQAAANEEAIILSLGTRHSFPLETVFDYLRPATSREILIQALLDAPMFEARWRWNATRSLVIERQRGGKRVPAPLIRMRANDLLSHAFPEAIACPETLPGGDLPVPMEHPLVRQTVEDCLHEAMDVDGFLEVMDGLATGRIERVACDTAEPSAFARGILASQPYTFLDDAPLEERRTQAVLSRRTLDPRIADNLGALDPDAVARVQDEAWPRAESAEEVHESLCWIGYVTRAEAASWDEWLAELKHQGRVTLEGDCWYATDATRDPLQVLKGRMEALGPISADDPRIAACAGADSIEVLLTQLENNGAILRTRIAARNAWCERRLLARIQRYTIDRLRSEIEPVSTMVFLQYLSCWQHVDPEYKLEGPLGVKTVLRQLAGFQIPSAAWESAVLPLRVGDYRQEWLDELTLQGEFAWGRLWGDGAAAARIAPVSLIPREDLERWLALSSPPRATALYHPAREILRALNERGPMFATDLQRSAKLLSSYVEMGLSELVARGLVTCDSFGGLRQLVRGASRHRASSKSRPARAYGEGRWSLFRPPRQESASMELDAQPSDALRARAKAARRYERAPEVDDELAYFVARQMLQRTGIVFRRTMLREKQPLPWYPILRALRHMELRGEVRGGRFVAGFSGEQYALPEAVDLLRKIRKRSALPPLKVSAADPLNFAGILTTDSKVSPTSKTSVILAA